MAHRADFSLPRLPEHNHGGIGPCRPTILLNPGRAASPIARFSRHRESQRNRIMPPCHFQNPGRRIPGSRRRILTSHRGEVKSPRSATNSRGADLVSSCPDMDSRGAYLASLCTGMNSRCRSLKSRPANLLSRCAIFVASRSSVGPIRSSVRS